MDWRDLALVAFFLAVMAVCTIAKRAIQRRLREQEDREVIRRRLNAAMNLPTSDRSRHWPQDDLGGHR
jgi:hypothetical protein